MLKMAPENSVVLLETTNLDGKSIWVAAISTLISIVVIFSLIFFVECCCCKSKKTEGKVPVVTTSRPPVDAARVSHVDPRYKTLREEDSFQASDKSVKDLRKTRKEATKTPQSDYKPKPIKVIIAPIPISASQIPTPTPSNDQLPKEKSKSILAKAPSIRDTPDTTATPNATNRLVNEAPKSIDQMKAEQEDKERREHEIQEQREQRERDRLWREKNRTANVEKKQSPTPEPPKPPAPPVIPGVWTPARTVMPPLRSKEDRSKATDRLTSPQSRGGRQTTTERGRKPAGTPTIYLPPNANQSPAQSINLSPPQVGSPTSMLAKKANEDKDREKMRNQERANPSPAATQRYPPPAFNRPPNPTFPVFGMGRGHHPAAPRPPPPPPPPRGDPNQYRSRIL